MFQFHSIRFRLTATFIAIILAVMVIVSLFLYNTLHRYYMNNMQDNLMRSGIMASEFVVGHMRGQIDSVRLSLLAENISRQSQARVVFTEHEGVVVGDSVRIGGLLNQKLEHEDVYFALNGEISSSIGFSERIQQPVMQLAIPVEEENGTVIGVVFLVASLEEVNHTLYDIRRFLLLATVFALALVGGGSILLARRFTLPLEELTTAVYRMGEGKLEQHIKVTSGDEIGRLAEQFNKMALRLNYYTGNLKKFAADVSHEVRTPLATLSLIAKALKEYEIEPELQREFIEDLDLELERLIALVNDLLELSKLEKLEINMENVDLNILLQDIIRQNQYRFGKAGLNLVGEITNQTVTIPGAVLQLRQVLNNILDNALNHTAPGGWVRISLYVNGTEAVVKVEDTGSGIPKEDLSYIFERFYRVDQARSREEGGTGLGLAIVSEIIAKHSGRVWVESEEGKGSSFYIALPLAKP